MDFDPTNMGWPDYYGLYSQQLGGLLRQSGKLDAAAIADADAARVLSALTAKDPTSTDWPPDLAQAQLETARLQMAREDIGAAEVSANSALATVRKLRAKMPDDRSLILLEAQTELMLGRAEAQRLNIADARHDWTQARDLLQPALHAGNDPNFLAAYVEALLGLDDTEGARPVIAKLNAMGYRTPDFVTVLAGRGISYPVNHVFTQRIAETMK